MISQRMLRHVKVTVYQRDGKLKPFTGYSPTPDLKIKDGFLTIDKDLTDVGKWIINMSEVKFIDIELVHESGPTAADLIIGYRKAQSQSMG